MNYQRSSINMKKRINKRFDNQFSILNGPKYFSSEMVQNDLVFIPHKKAFNTLVALLRLTQEI